MAINERPVVTSPLQNKEEDRFKRGHIIHRLLQTLPDLKPDERVPAAGKFLSQNTYDLASAEKEEIINEVLLVLNHPEFSPIFGFGSRAEVSIMGVVGGKIISAQLDRLLVTKSQVFIVDFKTNRPPPTTPDKVDEIYLHQMAAYRLTIQNIYPNREIKCALLWTVGAYLMVLEPNRLLKYESKVID